MSPLGLRSVGVTSDDSTPNIRTHLTDMFGIDHPILLAAMGDTAGGRLAAAVSAAGGLGFLGGGYADPAWFDREIELAGDARIGIGFITWALAERPEMLDVALAAEPAALQLSFGDPRPFAPRIRDAGVPLVCQVQSDSDIDQALEAGADLLIAQGRDAGGHGRPDRGTMGLVPSVVDRADGVPVVAAGGIADGRGLVAALALGAVGVSLGTRFLATTESIHTPAEVDALVRHGSGDTVRTSVIEVVRGPLWPDGHDGRMLRNALVQRWHDDIDGAMARRDELKAAYDASDPQDYDTRVVWAGEGLDLIDSIPTAADVIDSIIAEARHTLEAMTRLASTS